MNYTDEQQKRINNVYNEREKALAENQQTYSGLLDDANSFRQQQNQMLAQQEKTQNEVLDKQLENQTNIINQQKEQAQKQTETQNKQALNSYNAFINPYGYQAESLASTGLNNSGLSETAKLSAYTTYQNRVAQANASLQNAITNYDNSINEAILNNDVQKAQNALTRLQAELQANESYYNTKSSLTQNLLNNKLNINSQYDNQYNNVYNQVLNEQKQAEAIRQYNQNYQMQQQQLAESIRQYNEKMAYQKQRDAVADAQWQKEYELSKKKVSSRGGSSSGSYKLSNNSSSNNSKGDSFGNSAETTKKSDYYFKSTTGPDYQPRYINNTKLTKSGFKLASVGTIKGVSGGKNVWNANGRFYVWDENKYIDITGMVSNAVKTDANGNVTYRK